jgi:hypothetical protein
VIVARIVLRRCRIAATRDAAQNLSRFIARRVGRPRRAMPTKRLKALSATGGAISQNIRDGIALLPRRTKTGNGCIPNRFAWL